MSLIVVGLNHRTAPVELLERTAVPAEQLPKALHDLSARDHLLETVVLSTCNRTEIYAFSTKFHAAVGDVSGFLSAWSGADPEQLAEHLYSYYEDAAVRHLFSVAAGLDSMIVGEHEILGQVGDAWRVAEREEAAGQYVSRAFRHAVESGKRVRTETDLGRHPVSISSAAVSVAGERLGGYAGCRVVVVGAGEMGAGVARALRHRDAAEICIANRTLDRASTLADEIGATAISLDGLAAGMVDADVVFLSTASNDVLLARSDIEAVMSRRDREPLLLVDLALPRDIDPGAAEIEDVTLLDIDDLKDFAARSADRRRREIARVRDILDAELDRHQYEQQAREMSPLITSLRARAEEIRRSELDRVGGRLESLEAEELAAVESLTSAIVNKLLHEPTVRLKDNAGTDRGELFSDTVAELFDLTDPE